MDDLLEKVANGLECCVGSKKVDKCGWQDGDFPECPYNENTDGCVMRLLQDARSLLKAQEPRVMTFEEWENAPEPLDGECMCYEIKDKGLEAVLVKAFKGCKEYYGKDFRCWTSRPTDEQREAVKWDG